MYFMNKSHHISDIKLDFNVYDPANIVGDYIIKCGQEINNFSCLFSLITQQSIYPNTIKILL